MSNRANHGVEFRQLISNASEGGKWEGTTLTPGYYGDR